MPNIKSLEDLKRIREEALQKRDIKSAEARAQIVVAMGTPGIAAGARDTLKEFLTIIEERNLTGILIRQTGNMGMDSWEPVVQVILDGVTTTYGRVTPFAAREIMENHILGGAVVTEYVIPA
jgi:NADP-reducing hydrogenase subunit HndB